jgi:hypothetical protein
MIRLLCLSSSKRCCLNLYLYFRRATQLPHVLALACFTPFGAQRCSISDVSSVAGEGSGVHFEPRQLRALRLGDFSAEWINATTLLLSLFTRSISLSSRPSLIVHLGHRQRSENANSRAREPPLAASQMQQHSTCFRKTIQTRRCTDMVTAHLFYTEALQHQPCPGYLLPES